MASFCSSCGFPLGASNAFCPNCGARMAAQPVQPVIPAAPVNSVPVKSGSGLKILLVVVCVLFAFGVAAIGGAWYVAHRVKQAVISKAATYGVDLKSVTAPTTSSSSRSAPLRKPCDYLSTDQVSRIIGEPIARAVSNESACLYFGPPGLAAKLGAHSMSAGMQEVQGAKAQNPQFAEGINNLINGMGAQGGEEKPLLMIFIGPDAKAQMTALNVAGGLFGQFPGAKPEEISGLGDRAVRFANLGLNVMKGDNMMRIIAGPIPDPDNKTVEIAKAILPLI